MSGVTLITPTGGRPESFELCVKWVARNLKNYLGDVQWLVIDDCDPKTVTLAGQLQYISQGLYFKILTPEPPWASGQNTLARNLLAAIPFVTHENILFFEDDDFYSEDYITTMCEMLEQADIVGCSVSYYYHVPSRQYRILEHTGRSSLSQTGIRKSELKLLRRVCEESSEYIDVRLWESSPSHRYFSDCTQVIGMKGLPGRPGLGMGHRPDSSSEWQKDSDLSVLRDWIGVDIKYYLPYVNGVKHAHL